jgi:hypothetical protein
VGGDLRAISSKEHQQQQQDQEEASNAYEDENLEKLGEEIVLTKDQDEKEADDETRLNALATTRTKNAAKRDADQESQDTIDRDDQIEQGRVFISPSHPALNYFGGVSSICKSWDENEAQGKIISGILFNHSYWMCHPGSVGNKLGLYFQARAFASLHGVSYQIT